MSLLSAAAKALKGAPPCVPLAGRLVAVERVESRISHIVFDARVSTWLRAVLEDAQMRLGRHRFEGPVVLLSCEAAEGRIDLVLEKADMGAAVEMTLELPERALACQVLTALLRPWAQKLQPLFTGLRVVAFEARPHWPESTTLHTRGLRIGLAGADERAAEHVQTSFAGVSSPELNRLAPLRVRARLQLLVRRWPRRALDDLHTGDVVLLPGHASPRRLAARLIFGMGVTMETSTELSMDDDLVEVDGSPGMATGSDNSEVADEAASALETLQLPISFEIDTARISLAEMASIQPGFIVELDVPLSEATVRLICHGQTVGLGQLVAVGSQLGVRITRMGLQHDTLAQR